MLKPLVLHAVAGACLSAVAGAVARDGDLDPNFADGGMLVRPFPGDLAIQETYVDLERLPDGKLLVSASVLTGTKLEPDMGVMRLHADGTLDTSFGQAGARLIAFDRPGSDLYDIVRGITLQADGKIILVGDASGTVGGTDFAIARINADGSVDTSFGSGGKTTIAFDLGSTPPRRDDRAVRAAVLADGRIVVGGAAWTATGVVAALARLTAAGQPDPSFDGDGKRFIDFGGGLTDQAIAYTVLPAADGQRLYAASLAMIGGNAQFGAARLNADGSMDASFGGDGSVTFGFDIGGDLGDAASDLIEQPDGKLLLCGTARVAAPSNGDFACMRLNANGTVDGSFLPALIPFDLDGRGLDEAIVMRTDAWGRTLLAGYASVGETALSTNFDLALVRMLPSGQVDPSFGLDGRAHYVSRPAPDPDRSNRAWAMSLAPHGAILLAGAAAVEDMTHTYHVQIVRLVGDTLFDDGFEPLPQGGTPVPPLS